MRRFFFFLGLVLIAVWYLSRPVPIPENIAYGVTFSVPYARDDLGLKADWKKAYLAILDDLKVRRLRIPAYWTEHEKEEGRYNFDDLDFLLKEAGKRKADVILVVGEKLPRWPECFFPEWAKQESLEERHRNFLNYLQKVIERYKGEAHIRYWQIENEPFLPFGECKNYDGRFVDAEISRVKSLDSRPIIVTDSGELSIWAQAYRRADVFGTTMYRTIENKYVGTFTYPLRPGYFRMKARLMQYVFGKKPIIVIELQAEPWTMRRAPEVPIETQLRLMNRTAFKGIIEYEKAAGFPEVYLWGAEWWYWLKEKQKNSEMWDAAKNLFGGREL